MNIKEALSIKDLSHLKLDLELILSNILNQPREYIFTHSDNELTTIQQSQYNSMVRRLRNGEPLAYILGYKEFYGLKFKVNQNVLIPRPETETLIDIIVNDIKLNIKKSSFIRIIDVGTGSGAIIISITNRLKLASLENDFQIEFHASDISDKALEVAKQNEITILGEGVINFHNSDLLSDVDGTFDIVIANLPYIPKFEITRLDKNVRDFEPALALDGGSDGLVIIKKLILQCRDRLKSGGSLYLEIGENQAETISKFAKINLTDVKLEIIPDLTGKERFVKITR